MTDPAALECPPPPPSSLDDLRAELDDFKSSIMARLDETDSLLHDLIYAIRGKEQRAAKMLEAALLAARESGDSE